MKFYLDKLWCINCGKIRDKEAFRNCSKCEHKLESYTVKNAYYCKNKCDEILCHNEKPYCHECTEDKEGFSAFLDNEYKLQMRKKEEMMKKNREKKEYLELESRMKNYAKATYPTHYHCDICNKDVVINDIGLHLSEYLHYNKARNYILKSIYEKED